MRVAVFLRVTLDRAEIPERIAYARTPRKLPVILSADEVVRFLEAVPSLKAFVPHGHWKTMTFIAALRHDAITAACVFVGPINGESFPRYIEQFLLPTLKPGDLVIMDNLGSHEGQAVRAAIKTAGVRLLFLPPHSRDPNPIEPVFAKLKHLLRNAKERTREATWQRIGSLLTALRPTECSNYTLNH